MRSMHKGHSFMVGFAFLAFLCAIIALFCYLKQLNKKAHKKSVHERVAHERMSPRHQMIHDPDSYHNPRSIFKDSDDDEEPLVTVEDDEEDDDYPRRNRFSSKRLAY